jgi:hypothetical protein
MTSSVALRNRDKAMILFVIMIRKVLKKKSMRFAPALLLALVSFLPNSPRWVATQRGNGCIWAPVAFTDRCGCQGSNQSHWGGGQ